MLENADANAPTPGGERSGSSSEYLRRARAACAAGDAVLGMHLYLAAFEKAAAEGYEPGPEAIGGLKQAWKLACRLKERSLAEYIFGKLEPFLSREEASACADELQQLAIDKLEEFGFSREDLEDMTDMISQDFLGLDARIVKVEHLTQLPGGQLTRVAGEAPADAAPVEAPQEAVRPVPSDSSQGGEGDEPGPDDVVVEADVPHALPSHGTGSEKPASDASPDSPLTVGTLLSRAAEAAGVKVSDTVEHLTYDDLAGYDEAVRTMREFGVGMQHDPAFNQLVETLNARHGLDRMPAADTLLFRSPAREDAGRFMAATLGELDLPCIRMHMEENLQGMPVLCVMAQADNAPKLSSARDAFLSSGVLLLEDLDLWSAPSYDAGDEFGPVVLTSLSRGAREAINLIRAAVENPDVYVLASTSEEGEIDPFFYDLLEPLSVVDIDYPTPEERVDIWMEIAREHPSVRGVNRADLVRLSANMPRYDMYLAAREAIEEAYKESLVTRRYVPVTRDNLFDKLAAYQPLESPEYHELEEAVIRDFRADLEHIDDILKG